MILSGFWPRIWPSGAPSAVWDEGVRWWTTLVTPPTEIPISVAMIRDKVLRVANDTVEDALIRAWIEAVTHEAEEANGQCALMPQTWQMTLDRLPAEIVLPRPPLIEILSFEYIDADGTTQAFGGSPDEYQVTPSGYQRRARVRALSGESWPATLDQPNAVTITYLAGYESVTRIPPIILAGIGVMVGELYNIRGLSVQGVNTSVPAQLQMERFWHHRWS